MTRSNNNTRGIVSNTLDLAKKIGETGFDLLNHVAPKSVTKLSDQPDERTVIQASESQAGGHKPKYDNPQQMMREHVPQLSRQLLGRHYNRVNSVASFISPSLNDKMSDYFFEKLNDFVSNASSVEHVLKEVGARDLQELRGDVARSERISQALANQNKVIAVVQGSLTGLSGVVGAAIDVPTSLALALRMVYQAGRAHGFELDRSDEQDVVQYIFKQIDFGSIAEKQALLVAVRTVSNVLQTHNVQQLQQFLGSDSNAEPLKKWLSNEDGSLKWTWVDKLPQMGFLNKLTPLAGAGISALYSWKLVEDANEKAIMIFSQARRYLILHPDEQLSALVAYEKSEKLLAEASPILLADVALESSASAVQPQTASEPNQVIADVKVLTKQETEQAVVEDEKTLTDLATQYVEPSVEETTVPEVQVESADKEQGVLNEPSAKEEQVSVKEQLAGDEVQPETEQVASNEPEPQQEQKPQQQQKTEAAATEVTQDNNPEVAETANTVVEKKQPELKRSKKSS